MLTRIMRLALLGLMILFLNGCSKIIHVPDLRCMGLGGEGRGPNCPGIFDSNTFTGANVRLIGRFDRSTANLARFSWPGSAIEFRFTGPAIFLGIGDTGKNRFLVEVDSVSRVLITDPIRTRYLLASELADTEHVVRVTRLTEASFGVSEFFEDPQVLGGTLLAPPTAPNRRLLVIGDSITTGYGVEGANSNCPFNIETENQQLTYAAVAAHSLGADLQTIAVSGIGVWRNYGNVGTSQNTMPSLYNRILTGNSSLVWNPANYAPDAIIVNLNTNDFWQQTQQDVYQNAMESFVTQLRQDYPSSRIYLLLSPYSNAANPAFHQTPLQNVIVNRAIAGDANLYFADIGHLDGSEGYGCQSHPNQVTQARMGANLTARLQADLGW